MSEDDKNINPPLPPIKRKEREKEKEVQNLYSQHLLSSSISVSLQFTLSSHIVMTRSFVFASFNHLGIQATESMTNQLNIRILRTAIEFPIMANNS